MPTKRKRVKSYTRTRNGKRERVGTYLRNVKEKKKPQFARSKILSVYFDRSKWEIPDARKWLTENGYHAGNPIYYSYDKYYRFRQRSSSFYKRKHYRFLDSSRGIMVSAGYK